LLENKPSGNPVLKSDEAEKFSVQKNLEAEQSARKFRSRCCQMVYILIPKIPIWTFFGEPCNGKCWLFYCYSEYFTDIWYILCPFGTFFTVLVCCAKKNLATLVSLRSVYYKSEFGNNKVT
jgi:hypothetical protein